MDPLIQVKSHGTFTVVEFQTSSLMRSAELDRIATALMDLLDNDHTGRIVLDLTPVQYLSSQAITIIINIRNKTAAIKGGRCVLCGVSPRVLQLLKTARIDRLIEIVADQNAATGV